MLTFILIAENEKERNILTIALQQRGVKVLHSGTRFENYVFIMQYLPDVILIELPYYSSEQISFIRRLRQFKKTHNIPIISYGDVVPVAVENGITQSGATTYIARPLKFGLMLRRLEQLLKAQKKTLDPLPVLSEKENDITKLLSEDILPMQKIEIMTKHVTKLFAFPFTVAKVLCITQNERSGAAELARAITADPHMSTYILKISNSVLFGSINSRISSVKDAIVRIGFNETKKIVLSMSVISLFDKKDKNAGFDRIDFWYHSLAVALFAEKLAHNFGDINQEEAFLAGLLHDLGIMLLDDFFPSVFTTILENTSKNAGLFYNYEKELLKVSQLDMIAELFPQWRLPTDLTEALVKQYAIASSTAAPEGKVEKLAFCVAFGNAAAKLLHLGRECDEYVIPLNNDAMRAAKLPHGLTKALIDEISSQITIYGTFLNLEKRTHKCDCPEGIDPTTICVGICNPDNELFVPPQLFFSVRSIQVDTIHEGTAAAELNNRFHIVVYWTTKPVKADLIDKLSTLRAKPFPEIPETGSVAKLFIFSPAVEAEAPENQTNNRLLGTSLDYRVFEEQLTITISQMLRPAGSTP